MSARNLIILATGSGILVRSVAMMAFNFLLLPLPPPIGFSDPTQAVIPILPLIAFFNATVVLYSVPFAYVVVRACLLQVQVQVGLLDGASSTKDGIDQNFLPD